MINFKLTNDVYIYDMSIEGLLTSIYDCFKKKIIPKSITYYSKYEETLFDNIIEIETNFDNANNLNNKLLAISDYSFYLVYTSFLSDNPNKEIIILKYFIEAMTLGSKINGMKNNDSFITIYYICKKVGFEAHRLTGFLRFKEINGGILYSAIEPDNNIIEILVKHFSERLKNKLFIIYDKKRGLIVAYNKKEYNFFTDEEIDIAKLENESITDQYEELWKKYFDTITIKERTNKRCQMNFMPKKYWKNMIEMEGK